MRRELENQELASAVDSGSQKLGRLLGIVLLLRSRDSVSAELLADRFGVSVRTIYRDIATLQSAGVPVIGTVGRVGGYQLQSEDPLPPLILESERAFALYLLSVGNMDLPDSISAVGNRALRDLEAGQTEDIARLFEVASKRIHFDTTEWYWRDEGTALLPKLRESLFGQQRVALNIAHADGSMESSTVAPYGLIWKGGQWYLVGATENDRVRRVKLSSIVKVTGLDSSFDYPDAFDLSQWWRDHLESFGKGPNEVRITVTNDASTEFRRLTTKQESRIEELGDGGLTLTLYVDDWLWLVPMLLSYAGSVRIHEPAELRTAVLGRAEQLLNMNAHRTDRGTIERRTVDDSRSRATRGRGGI